MRTALLLATLILPVSVLSQPPAVCEKLLSLSNFDGQPRGFVHGFVIAPDGRPAKGLQLNASWLCPSPGGCAISRPSSVVTDEAGEYCFGLKLGRYSVSADDEKARYSAFSTPLGGNRGSNLKVELTAENSDVELPVKLPPKASLLLLHVTDVRTRKPIDDIWVRVSVVPELRWVEEIELKHMTGDYSVLLPFGQEAFVQVFSTGYDQWIRGSSEGRVILTGSTDVDWDVELEPLGSRQTKSTSPSPESAQ